MSNTTTLSPLTTCSLCSMPREDIAYGRLDSPTAPPVAICDVCTDELDIFGVSDGAGGITPVDIYWV